MDGSVKDDTVTKLYEPGEAIPKKWKTWFRLDRQHSSKWRENAREDYDFVAGRQWAQEDKALLKEENRPSITFNRTSVLLEAVSGNEMANKQEIRYIPREEGDAAVNDILSEAARWFDDETDAGDEESEAFEDTITAGMGWTETLLDFDDDPDGTPITAKMDPIEMYWDRDARKTNLKDARRMWRIRSFSKEEAREKWPDTPLEDIDAGNWLDGSEKKGATTDDPENRYDNDEARDDLDERELREHNVRVIHMQYWAREPIWRVVNPMTGKIETMSEAEYEQLSSKLKMIGQSLRGIKQVKKRFYQAFIGAKVLSHGEAPCPDAFSWQCITGKFDRNMGTWYGLVRVMREPQQWANKWLSQTLHIMNSNAKGGLLAEEGVFVDERKAEQDWADPSAIIKVKRGALVGGALKERGAGQIPSGFQQLTEFAMSAIRDVTGINLEFLGMREANQPGVLEYQRRQAGLTVLGKFFNNLRRYRRARGRVMLYFIQEHLSDGRLVRIVSQGNQQYVPLVKQAEAKYDMIIDEAPSSPNQKEMIWSSLTQILPGIKDIVPPKVLLELLDYSPLPKTIVERIKSVVNEPDPMMQERKKIEVQQMMVELGKTDAQKQLITKQVQESETKAALNEAKVVDVLVNASLAQSNPEPRQ